LQCKEAACGWLHVPLNLPLSAKFLGVCRLNLFQLIVKELTVMGIFGSLAAKGHQNPGRRKAPDKAKEYAQVKFKTSHYSLP
jgi:hypothetical protein